MQAISTIMNFADKLPVPKFTGAALLGMSFARRRTGMGEKAKMVNQMVANFRISKYGAGRY